MERGRLLAKQITTNGNGFADTLIFTTPGGSVTKTVKGLAIKHSTVLNDFGAGVRGKTARVTVCEDVLHDAAYPIRNEDNTVNLKDHRVTWTDSEGITATYVITEILPDRSVGIIRCTLGEYRTGDEPRKIIGWKVRKVNITLKASPSATVVDDGNEVSLECAPNVDGTLTVAYLTSVAGITVLSPMLIGENSYQNVPYTAGTFGNLYGNFAIGDIIAVNASLPVYQV